MQNKKTCVSCEGIFNGDKVLQRLGHLAAGDGKVARVQEIAYPVVIVKVGLYRHYPLNPADQKLGSFFFRVH